MKGIVLRITPVSICDPPALEGWLEQMSAQCLHPRRIGEALSWFQPEAGGPRRFRVEPYGGQGRGLEPNPVLRELYQDSGWEYVRRIGGSFFLFSTADPAAPEPHTDPVIRGLSLEGLARRSRRYLWSRCAVYLLILAVFLLTMLLPSRFDVQPNPWARLPLLALILTQPTFLCLLVLYLISILNSVQGALRLLRLHQRLAAGVIVSGQDLPPLRVRGRNRLLVGVFLLTLLTLPFSSSYAKEIPISQFDQPYLALQELEQEPLIPWGPEDSSRFQADENMASLSPTLLAPVWYEVRQGGYSPTLGERKGFSPAGGDYTYSPSLDAVYFRLLLPALAQPMACSQLDVFRAVNIRWSYTEQQVEGVDWALLATNEEGIWQMAALVKGNRAAVFCYGGQAQLSDNLDLLAQWVR